MSQSHCHRLSKRGVANRAKAEIFGQRRSRFRTARPHHEYCRTIQRSTTEPCLCSMVLLNSTWAASKDSLIERALSFSSCTLSLRASKKGWSCSSREAVISGLWQSRHTRPRSMSMSWLDPGSMREGRISLIPTMPPMQSPTPKSLRCYHGTSAGSVSISGRSPGIATLPSHLDSQGTTDSFSNPERSGFRGPGVFAAPIICSPVLIFLLCKVNTTTNNL